MPAYYIFLGGLHSPVQFDYMSFSVLVLGLVAFELDFSRDQLSLAGLVEI